jgi:hypothetical protein
MMRVLLEVETPLSTTINVSNQTLMIIYQKLKTNKQVKKIKASQETIKIKGHFLFDFLDTDTNFKTL